VSRWLIQQSAAEGMIFRHFIQKASLIHQSIPALLNALTKNPLTHPFNAI